VTEDPPTDKARAMDDALPPIVLAIETSAAPSEAWKALTDPSRVAEWFTTASRVGKPGTPYRLDFGEGSVVEGVIMEVDPGRRLTYTWAWADGEPRQETVVTWRVEPLEGGGSRVVMVHDGWAESGADEAVREDHEGYWTGYLDDLGAILVGRT
jgi:uncharacterized protein YndB with AHSA1/START domain